MTMSPNYNNFYNNSEQSSATTGTTVTINNVYKKLFFVSVLIAFSVGLTVGILIRIKPKVIIDNYDNSTIRNNHSESLINDYRKIDLIFVNNSSNPNNNSKQIIDYPTVSFVQNNHQESEEIIDEQINDNETSDYVVDGIYWSDLIEKQLPIGFNNNDQNVWTNFINNPNTIGIKLDLGCGRMQNRLITFNNGDKGCIRYRQNIDQIQGELFSYYLSNILNLTNLVPSTINLINLNQTLWKNLTNDIIKAKWQSNKPIVITKFINNLNYANIPQIFKPIERHLNKFDIINITNNLISNQILLQNNLIELIQWSDLIIFDYLTANLDRIVNNLYNYQWNINIMDAPAHNLAKKIDNNLLIFLDNESGLLHGYRLLKKYEIYHKILLDNLCLFRRQTVNIIKQLKELRNIGQLLNEQYNLNNNKEIRDILPTLPDKTIKILNERIDNVYNQISKCEQLYSNSVV